MGPDALFNNMLAGRTGFRIEKIRFIGTEANDKEPGSTEVGRVPQFPNRIDFGMLHFGPTNVGEAILARSEHFTTLTDEGHVMVRVMTCHVPTLLRIDECVKMAVQPCREHRTWYRERLWGSLFDGPKNLSHYACLNRQRYDDNIVDTTRRDGGPKDVAP